MCNNTINADATGHDVIIVDTVNKERVTNSEFFKRSQNSKLTLSNYGISSLLHHAISFNGQSVYKDYVFLYSGDSFNPKTNKININFPYFSRNSTGASHPDISILKQELTKSYASRAGEKLLMLSSGKDSVSLALAAAETGGANTRCVTFSNGGENEEAEYASALCDKLGLKHKTIYIPNDPSFIEKSLINYFEKTPIPCVDHVQVPYILALYQNINAGELIIDGMGNDVYVGHCPTLKVAQREKKGLANLYALRHLLPLDSILNEAFKTRAEMHLSGYLPRLKETQKFYPPSGDTFNDLKKYSQQYFNYDVFDFRAIFRGRYLDQGPGMQKARNAAQAVGSEVFFPWATQNVIDYYFNLPEKYRFNREKSVNKIIVRDMLKRYCGYDESVLPKRGFEFNAAKFIFDNQSFIINTIFGCSLWDKTEIEVFVKQRLAQLYKNDRNDFSILTLFMLSGWHTFYYEAA